MAKTSLDVKGKLCMDGIHCIVQPKGLKNFSVLFFLESLNSKDKKVKKQKRFCFITIIFHSILQLLSLRVKR